MQGVQSGGRQSSQPILAHRPNIFIGMSAFHTENAPGSASGIVKHKAVFARRTRE